MQFCRWEQVKSTYLQQMNIIKVKHRLSIETAQPTLLMISKWKLNGSPEKSYTKDNKKTLLLTSYYNFHVCNLFEFLFSETNLLLLRFKLLELIHIVFPVVICMSESLIISVLLRRYWHSWSSINPTSLKERSEFRRFHRPTSSDANLWRMLPQMLRVIF